MTSIDFNGNLDLVISAQTNVGSVDSEGNPLDQQDTVNLSAIGIGVGGGQSIGNGDRLLVELFSDVEGESGKYDTAPSYTSGDGTRATATSISFTIAQVQGSAAATTTFTLEYTTDGENWQTVPVGDVREGDVITLQDADGIQAFRITGTSESTAFDISLGGSDGDAAADAHIELPVIGSDVDGDQVQGSIVIGFDQDGTAGLILPSAGSDTMIASGGADTFAWSLADQNSDGDVIKNFDDTEDAIDLGDLLTGYDSDNDLSSFIQVTTQTTADGTTNTIITVDSDGDGSGADQTITIEGVDLVNGETELTTILNNLIAAGNLIDPDSGG